MFLLEEKLIWTASDLAAAVECEYALLRTVDYRLGWADKPDFPEDPLLEQLARLGDRHEQRLLTVRRGGGRDRATPGSHTVFCGCIEGGG